MAIAGVWIAFGCTTILLGACAVGPDFSRPAPPSVKSYVPDEPASGPGSRSDVRYVNVDQIPERWWRAFSAPALDETVAEALRRSPTLATAQAMLRQSIDARRAGYGVFMPQVSLDANVLRERSAPLRLGSDAPGSIFNVFTLAGSVGYVLDAFGGERRRVEVLGAQVDETRESARATYLTLTANVVATSIARSAYAQAASITRELIKHAETQTELARGRYLAGIGAFADVAALQAEVANLQATLPVYLQRQDQATYLLATLCGHAPSEWQPPVADLREYTLPSDLPLIVPSRLAEQRPDIRTAEARMHQSSANIGVATANMFPTITLMGSMGSASGELARLGTSDGHFWSGSGDVSVPLMQGGALWYTRRAAVEAYQASVQDYRRTVLQALDQVAETLRALDHDAEVVAAAESALGASDVSLRLAEANYSSGISDYLSVLVALRALETSRLGHAQAYAQQLQDAVALFVALGGDWSTAPVTVVEGAH